MFQKATFPSKNLSEKKTKDWIPHLIITRSPYKTEKFPHHVERVMHVDDSPEKGKLFIMQAPPLSDASLCIISKSMCPSALLSPSSHLAARRNDGRGDVIPGMNYRSQFGDGRTWLWRRSPDNSGQSPLRLLADKTETALAVPSPGGKFRRLRAKCDHPHPWSLLPCLPPGERGFFPSGSLNFSSWFIYCCLFNQ